MRAVSRIVTGSRRFFGPSLRMELNAAVQRIRATRWDFVTGACGISRVRPRYLRLRAALDDGDMTRYATRPGEPVKTDALK